MKKYFLILLFVFLGGCIAPASKDFDASVKRLNELKNQYDQNIKESSILSKQYEICQNKQNTFLFQLNNKQLEEYNLFRSAMLTNDSPGIIIHSRNLNETLREQQRYQFWPLIKEEIEIIARAQEKQKEFDLIYNEYEKTRAVAVSQYNLKQEQQKEIQKLFKDMGEAYKKSQEPAIWIPKQTDNSTFWQEEKARREVLKMK